MKRWLAGASAHGGARRTPSRTRSPTLPHAEDARLWSGDLAAIASPPRGRVMDLVYVRLADELGVDVTAARATVAAAAVPHFGVEEPEPELAAARAGAAARASPTSPSLPTSRRASRRARAARSGAVALRRCGGGAGGRRAAARRRTFAAALLGGRRVEVRVPAAALEDEASPRDLTLGRRLSTLGADLECRLRRSSGSLPTGLRNPCRGTRRWALPVGRVMRHRASLFT